MRTSFVWALALTLTSMPLPAHGQIDRALTRIEFVKALQPFIRDWEARALLQPLAGGSINVFLDLEGAEREAMLDLSDRYMLFVGAFDQAGFFGPDLPIRRREAGLILASLLDRASTMQALFDGNEGPASKFHDLGPDTRYRMRHVLAAELLIGYPDNTFRPGRPLTHGQWAHVAERLGKWSARAQAVPPAGPRPPTPNKQQSL